MDAVPNTWSTDNDLFQKGKKAPFEACVNLENVVDRVDYAQYLFTGYILVEENTIQYRNVTMFSFPEDIVSKRSVGENFFHTFNFSNTTFVYEVHIRFIKVVCP